MPPCELYRHTRRRCWSLREGGRVVAHVEAVALAGVVLVVRPGALARVRARHVREVCEVARGTPTDAPRPPGARRLRFHVYGAGAFLADGHPITAAALAWFEADGTAWITLEN
ncbi:hypothetical protein SAMN02799631_00276 [Methylobacterium sp. 174MFSha1.1]|uniref:hypothetical protein n=1 Tax=Methylobacterium sp. 174MFSha1.1 TaxID=1502749 RepID=UPI0008ECF6E2|nr:hypothetical protein [Methylobacterium sp. 174MFSha1.1]SFU34789.1 hypothetical protein SAMN02799631_00276 [Methylobacterium sp. 174MFSha1.1]